MDSGAGLKTSGYVICVFAALVCCRLCVICRLSGSAVFALRESTIAAALGQSTDTILAELHQQYNQMVQEWCCVMHLAQVMNHNCSIRAHTTGSGLVTLTVIEPNKSFELLLTRA